MTTEFKSVKSRMKYLLKLKKLSEAKFEEMAGFSNGFVSKIGDSLREDSIEKIKNIFPELNRTWLIAGGDIGEMFRPNNSTLEESLPQYQITTAGKFGKGKEAFKISTEDGPRPYYNIDFVESFERIFEDKNLAPAYYIDYKPCEDVCWWFNVAGNGMHPLISNGDIIAVKIVDDWQTYLMPDEIYGIVTVNGIKTIRTVRFGNDAGYFSLFPSNKSYQTVEMPKSIISTVLKVRTVFKKSF